ncbi:mitochondrial carrier protein [Trypanosoma equiperdum]|uniref:Mitochondrial carrier protein, putative n=3 Tax=Trypanozoon TaxID=39700 RepID=Q57VA8_TRYB2|nr:mitochondrial carrier protein, putative [Trypanosoma brucei brucei TREU927]AAX70434.1 mitochondrial carrier protein, putative [Trypanosoma brucei]AAZ11270.1 mitochondrial carrier protein, putative [Trypanosoma brucei brucei TREU927]RHW72508.1 mitochondrial carrier protein [Trypanosoma brucei equiperdum]SCU69059.1 mitochondrial carrier protein [Trypanosoma equiperdum]
MALPTSHVVQTPKRQEYLASCLSGCVAGVCSTCVINPLDTVRVRLSVSRSATGKAHRSLLYTVRDLFEGGIVHAFSRGLSANLMASLPSNGIYLPTYRCIKDQLSSAGVNQNVQPAIAACGAVCVTNTILGPIFLVRTRVQVNEKLTVRQTFRDVLKHEGFSGFYRGTMTNIVGRFVEEGLFWSIYELLKRLSNEASFKGSSNFFLTSVAVASLSAVAKIAATTVSYPYNVVMNHMRSVSYVTGKPEYERIMPTIRHIYYQDGIPGFYKGLAPQLLRSTLSKAVQIYSFELAMFIYFSTVQRPVVSCAPA